MSYIPCMVYANRVLLTCMYHMNFAYGRFSPVRGCGFLVVAHVAPLRGRGWFRLGSVTTNRLTGAKLAAGHGPWVLSRVGCFPCLLGGVAWVAVGCFRGPVRFAALADMWMRPMTCLFLFCILLCLIISIPREFTIYVCLIISLPRGFTIFVVFTTSLYILALYILALFVVVY